VSRRKNPLRRVKPPAPPAPASAPVQQPRARVASSDSVSVRLRSVCSLSPLIGRFHPRRPPRPAPGPAGPRVGEVPGPIRCPPERPPTPCAPGPRSPPSRQKLATMTTKLYVGNLSWSCTAEDLTQAFSQYGEVRARPGSIARRGRHRPITRRASWRPQCTSPHRPPPPSPPAAQVSDAFVPSDRETGRCASPPARAHRVAFGTAAVARGLSRWVPPTARLTSRPRSPQVPRLRLRHHQRRCRPGCHPGHGRPGLHGQERPRERGHPPG
jgi:hypothetical protein